MGGDELAISDQIVVVVHSLTYTSRSSHIWDESHEVINTLESSINGHVTFGRMA